MGMIYRYIFSLVILTSVKYELVLEKISILLKTLLQKYYLPAQRCKLQIVFPLFVWYSKWGIHKQSPLPPPPNPAHYNRHKAAVILMPPTLLAQVGKLNLFLFRRYKIIRCTCAPPPLSEFEMVWNRHEWPIHKNWIPMKH